jgi:hypothetical protein
LRILITGGTGFMPQVLGFEPDTRREAGLAELVAWSRQIEAVDRFGHADAELRSRGLVTGDLGTRNVAP